MGIDARLREMVLTRDSVGKLRFSACNTGAGIDPQQIHELFRIILHSEL